MNKKNLFLLAFVLTLVVTALGLGASQAWANTKNGSLGPKIHEMHIHCSQQKFINMGDATFRLITDSPNCSFDVVRQKVPNTSIGSFPPGLYSRSDGFLVSVNLPKEQTATLEACFPYSPRDEGKNSAVYAYSNKEWYYLKGVVQDDPPKLLCQTTFILNGGFVLLGDQ